MAKKSALGKGIASLIQTNANPEVLKKAAEKMQLGESAGNDKQTLQKPPVQEEAATEKRESDLFLIEISEIKVNDYQPRKIFKEKELEELSQSIKEHGVLQPLVVTKLEKGFELVSGERRLRASKRAGLTKVPVVLKRATARDKLIWAILENVQREDLNCIEEALGYFQLIEEFKLTQEEVAKKVGKDRSSVSNLLRILKLPREVIELVQKDQLSLGHAKVLLAVLDKSKVSALALDAVKQGWSVRELEKKIKNLGRQRTEPEGDFEQDDLMRQKLEQRTGFQFKLNTKASGAGNISIKFRDKKEFDKLYDFLMK